MRIALESFRGEAPRLTPRALPPNGAQRAINARLQSGDLEAWRQFLEIERLAIAPLTIYLLNDRWMAWETDVDVARSPIPGDTTFRVYLTGPDEYEQPRWTDYSLAFQSPGGTPPSVTRPIGVPEPGSAPTLVVGVDSTPNTFSIDTLDDNASLATAWSVNPALIGARYAEVTQGSGFYISKYDENRDPGQEAYAFRNFGVSGVLVLDVNDNFVFAGDTSIRQACVIVGADGAGNGVGALYDNDGKLYILKTANWGVQFGTAKLASVALSPSLSAGVEYTMNVHAVVNVDGTKTVTARILNGATVLATVTATNNFSDGDYCGFANGTSNDAATQYQTNYSDYHVQASGSTNAQIQNVATSYVFTLVNDLGEESAPSPASATILRPDGVSVTVTTSVSVPTGISIDYGIETKRIYRAVTGPTGSIFRFVAEIPLAQADYIDTLTDAQLGESLESEGWALPPDDLRGILALPNGIMVGFRLNQLCFSAQNRPHAWPPAFRLTTDTDIVAIGAIDTAVIIGTHTFPYVAQGQSPADYAAAKLEVPQACVSKRGLSYVAGFGVVFPSPDGLMGIAGVAAPANLTKGIFTRKQWQALQPESMLGVSHDDCYHFFFDTTPTPPTPPASDPFWDDVILLSLNTEGATDESPFNATPQFSGTGTVVGNEYRTGALGMAGIATLVYEGPHLVRDPLKAYTIEGTSQYATLSNSTGSQMVTGWRHEALSYELFSAWFTTSGNVILQPFDAPIGTYQFAGDGPNTDLHLAFVIPAGANPPVRFYINGVLVLTVNLDVSGLQSADGKIIIGCEGNTSLTDVVNYRVRNVRVTAADRYSGSSFEVPETPYPIHGPEDSGGGDIGGTRGGYALDLKPDGFGLIELAYHATAAHADPVTDSLYLALDENDEPTTPYLPVPSTAPVPDGMTIYQFDGDPDSLMAYLYRGRLNLVPAPYAPSFVRVMADDFDNLVVRGYQDGLLQFEKVATSDEEFRVQTDSTAKKSYEQELIGTSRVQTFQTAEDIGEIE